MNKSIYVGLSTGKTLHLIITLGLVVLTGRAFNADAQTETMLHSFIGYPTDDGRDPSAKLVQGRDGNFYGTTYLGGSSSVGSVFRITPSGTSTTLYSFAGYPIDGDGPGAELVQGSDGNFYGTTYYGGTGVYCNGSGCGTVFRISPSGSYTTLYFFANSSNSGSNPWGLVQGHDGSFYGTTEFGGANNAGTVFRVSPGGTHTNLYSFGSHPADGARPYAGLVQGSDGNFYGTTYFGGASTNCSIGCGTVFQISPSGTYTTLYSFGSSPTDGYGPFAGLAQGSDGNFYGTTYYGGASTNCSGGCGTVFRIGPNGTYTNLYSFVGPPNDGYYPSAAPMQGSDGNFYGTTENGGTNNAGIVFRISPSGNYTIVYSFIGSANDGRTPDAGLVQGRDGSFYGTTTAGGTNNYGTVFRLTVPLNPAPYPINQITGVQLSGTNIVFNIPSIAAEIYQLQVSSSMNPTNWVNVPGVSVTNSIGALLTLTNFGGALQPQGFYRFDITP
ncbi:MAG TPA: choice-of-anchor tandem repeat GloVer-containing protein [Verrucomicrobiae bacterium]|nr:choice-of-anchor tandem repeat GloVer-containing protein [Verrucomicrobiae bacterium]